MPIQKFHVNLQKIRISLSFRFFFLKMYFFFLFILFLGIIIIIFVLNRVIFFISKVIGNLRALFSGCSTKQQSAKYTPKKKIFEKYEGEYVDFEEIKMST